jgi:hypothetical protein
MVNAADKRVIKFFFLLLIIVMAVDYVLGVVNGRMHFVDQTLGFDLWYGALQGPAALNHVLEEIWFAETIALILIPVIWLVMRLRVTKNMFPWLFLGVVMLVSFSFNVYRHIVNNPFHYPLDLQYVIHQGSGFYSSYGDSIDPLLASVWEYLLRAQIGVVVAFLVGKAILRLYSKRKIIHNKS